jgi:hypothetical protein
MLCGYGQSAQSGVDMARMHNAAWRITVEAVEKQMPQYPLSRLHTRVSRVSLCKLGVLKRIEYTGMRIFLALILNFVLFHC